MNENMLLVVMQQRDQNELLARNISFLFSYPTPLNKMSDIVASQELVSSSQQVTRLQSQLGVRESAAPKDRDKTGRCD
jgi:hypothetical protein